MAKSPNLAKGSQGRRQMRKDLIFVLCMLAVPLANFLVFWLWKAAPSTTSNGSLNNWLVLLQAPACGERLATAF